jgi:hypothetical protein
MCTLGEFTSVADKGTCPIWGKFPSDTDLGNCGLTGKFPSEIDLGNCGLTGKFPSDTDLGTCPSAVVVIKIKNNVNKRNIGMVLFCKLLCIHKSPVLFLFWKKFIYNTFY